MNTDLGSLRATTREAGWLEGAVARAVRAPLVLPELLVLAVDVHPELCAKMRMFGRGVLTATYPLHERQGVGGTQGRQKLQRTRSSSRTQSEVGTTYAGDVGVVARRVAVLGEGAVADERMNNISQ